MRIIALTLTIVLIIASVPASVVASQSGSIDLFATPSVIAADGRSYTTITAQLRDADGKLPPDGTQVRFTTSLGEIEDAGAVQAGSARVKLTSSNMPGTATVTATWVDGQAVARCTVEFGEAKGPEGPEYIEVQSDGYMGYSVDYKVLEAIGNVRLKYRSLELEAHSVQVDLARSRIVAKGESRTNAVKLHGKDGVTEASMFSCDFSASQGIMISSEQGKVRAVTVSAGGWEIGASDIMYMPEDFDFTDLSGSGVFVKSKSATIFANEKIHFRRANIYVDGKKMLSLPLYVLSLTGFQEDGEQYLGYSTGGISVNLPFYYSLTPKSSGTLVVRHGQSTGWSMASKTPGWFIDLKQRYRTDKSEGMLTLSQITNQWGAQITHSQRIGKKASGFFFLDYPAHESLYGVMNYSQTVGTLDFGLNLSGSGDSMSNTVTSTSGEQVVTSTSTTKNSRLSGDIHVQTRTKKIGKSGLSYNLSARDEETYDTTSESSTDGTSSETITRDSSQRLDANLYTIPIPLAKQLSLRCGSSLGYLFGDEDSGLSTTGNAVMDWKISKNNSLQLGYRYMSRPTSRLVDINPDPIIREYVRVRDRNGSQSLSASWRLGDGKKWWASLYALKGLNSASMNMFTDFNYRLSSDWRIGVHTTANRFRYARSVKSSTNPTEYTTVYETGQYSNLELTLGKKFGSREVLAVWSKDDGRVMLQLGSGGF